MSWRDQNRYPFCRSGAELLDDQASTVGAETDLRSSKTTAVSVEYGSVCPRMSLVESLAGKAESDELALDSAVVGERQA